MIDMIDKKSLGKAFGWSLIAIMVSVYFTYRINKVEDVKSLCEFMSNTLVDFGITFSAFTITAFSLIQLIKEKSWFSVVKKETDLIDRLSNGFQLAVLLSIISMFLGIFSRIFTLFQDLPEFINGCEKYLYNSTCYL